VYSSLKQESTGRHVTSSQTHYPDSELISLWSYSLMLWV